MKKHIIHILLFLTAFFVLDHIIGFCLNRGLSNYFGLNEPAEVLLVGHSHLMLAVDKTRFESGTGTRVAKYCREGVNVGDRHEMVKHYLSLPNSDSLRVVFYGVDQFMFNGGGLSQNSYKLFYPFMDNPIIDEYIRSSTDCYDYVIHKALWSVRCSDALLNSAIRGWRDDWSNYKIGKLNLPALERQIEQGKQRHIKFEQSMMETFESTLDLLEKRGVVTVLVNTPIARALNEYEPEEYARIIDYFQSKADSSDLIYYWDLNPGFSDRYELFYDPIHLNADGQRVINEELISRYNTTFRRNDIGSDSALQ